MADTEEEGDWSPWEKEELVEEDDGELIREPDCEEQQPLISPPPCSMQISQEEVAMEGDSILLIGGTPALLPQYVAALIATIGSFSIGCVLGYSSPAGPMLMHNSTHNPVILSSDQNNWFGSSMALGAVLGGPVCGFSLSILGRRGTMHACSVPFVGAWLIIAFAKNFVMLMIGRILTGFCCGVMSMAVTTYIGEYASPNVRGTLGASFQLMVTLGLLYAMVFGAIVSSWQVLAGICAIPPALYFFLLFFLKESPVFLLSKGKEEKAVTALQYFRGQNYHIQTELDMLRESIEEAKRNKASMRDLLEPCTLKPLLISMGLMFFQQFSGVNPVLFNLATIFEDSGSTMKAAYSSIIIAAVQVGATLFGVVLMDRAGRKILLIASSALMVISLVALGEFFYLKMEDKSWAVSTLGWLPLVSLIVFIFSFSYGYGPIPWLMMGELFAPNVREAAASIATLFNWSLAFTVTLIFLPLKEAIGDYGAYWMFSGLCVLNLIFCVTIVPETKGKTLEEITSYFGRPRTDEAQRRPRSEY